MFGLAAVAAVAAMAFIGAGTASAEPWSTQLCNNTPAASTLACDSATTEIHAVATNPLLETSGPDVLCHSSLAKATVLALGTAPAGQIAHLTELTWTNCHRHGQTLGECTVSTKLLGLLSILKLSLTDAHATGVAANPTVVLVECGAFIHCSYESKTTTTLLGLPTALNGTEKGTLHANTTVEKSSDADHKSLFCPTTSTWTALYASLTDVHFGS
jgi:hypothetical protein